MRSNKGFTLIELLVVIAIIGILSSVVLASLTTARSKGQAAAVQNQLSNMRAQAELYYSTNNNQYNSGANTTTCTAGMFSSTNGLAALIAGSDKDAALTCFASSTAWSVQADVDGTADVYCVDSTGKSVATSTVTTLLSNNLCI